MTISPPPASFNNGYCEYDNTTGVETFHVHIVCHTGNHDNYNNITETEVWGY